MSDTSRYGAQENVGGTGAVTADALVGTPLGGHTGDALAGSAAWGVYSTAPYKDPKARQAEKTPDLCHHEGCRQWHLKGEDFCRWHIER